MKKIILFVNCLLFSHFAFSQAKPIYFKGDKVTADSTKATSYAVYGKLSTEDLWIFKRFDLYNNLMQTGSYLDSVLTIPHGKFVFYNYLDDFNAQNNENYKLKGKRMYVSQVGNFFDGLEEGSWLLFFPDGTLFSKQNFDAGKLHGEYFTFDKYGKVVIQGNYKDGKRNGEWLFKNENVKVVYDMDNTISTAPLPKTNKNKPKS